MYILIVSLACAVMLGSVYWLAYGPEGLSGNGILETIVTAFLLFNAIDVGLRSVMDEPSWILKVFKKK